MHTKDLNINTINCNSCQYRRPFLPLKLKWEKFICTLTIY